MKRIFALAPVLLLVCVVSFSQSIQLMRFDNSLPYAAGSGVSVHFKPNLFKPGNTFTLQLSDAAGNFGSPKNIGTVSEFFAPVINGMIPAGTPVGGNYKLRVVGNNPGVISAVTDPFSIAAGIATTASSISKVLPAAMPIKCLTEGFMFGYLDRDANGSSPPMSFEIDGYNTTNTTYNAKLITSAGAVQATLGINTNGIVTVGVLPLGYYVVEIAKTTGGITTVFSYIVLVERNGTGLTNLSSELVCTGSPVQFKVEGISDNYPGSLYKVVYSDNSGNVITYTHDSLMANAYFSHTYTSPTCSSSGAVPDPANTNNRAFSVDLQLYNKGLSSQCIDFTSNSRTTKFVNASTPPVARFNVAPAICQSSKILATNTSIPGSYGRGVTCKTDFLSTWQYKKPSSADYEYAPDSWVDGITGTLTIPASEVTEAGCWMLRLEVQNPEGCTNISTAEKPLSIEVVPTPNFSINPPGICTGQSVQLTDQSNARALPCQNPTYSWSISPSSGFTPATTTDPNLQLTFNTGGVYTVTQSITNSCGTKVSSPKTITVGGAPTASFTGSPMNVCKPAPFDEVIDFSQTPYKPTYSTTPFAPTSYQWEVDGNAADYDFITSNTIDYPKIRFKTYRCYNIKVTVLGNCTPANNTTLQLCFKQAPVITNNSLSQTICSGATTNAVTLTTDMPGATVNWQAVYTGVTPATPPTGTNTIGAQTFAVSSAAAGNITYSLQAAINGCTGPSLQYVTTVTPAIAASISYETPLCNTVVSALVKRTGTAGGTYTGDAGLVIDANTGAISPSASTPGTHTITYTIPASPPCAGVSATATVTINQGNAASASISYPADLCNVTTANPPVAVNQTGTAGGVYTIAPSGLLIDPQTGTISPAGATAGTYTITYTIANTPGCADYKITTNVNIHSAAAATISYATPLCSNRGTVTVTRTGTAGGTYSAPTGLTIDANTGAINTTTSTPGNYTITYTVAAAAPCPGTTATADITITAAPLATISYPGTLCNVASTANTPNDPVQVIQTGTTGGTYTIAPTGLPINATNGTVTPSGAQPGTYTITYTIAAANGCAAYTKQTTVTVNGTPSATIAYASPICSSQTNASVTITGTNGGQFSATPTGLVINTTTGAINASQSTPGNYHIIYTIAASAPCPGATAETDIVITAAPTAIITYPANLCNVKDAPGTPNPAVQVVQTGTTGGVYSVSPAGLPINATTGEVNPSGATANTYTITYTLPASGGCAIFTTTAQVTVNGTPQATINYPGSPYCNSSTQPQAVTRTGTAGGIYQANSPGLSINANTGAINPSASSPGTYTITYTVTPPAPCYTFSTTTQVTITEAPTVSFATPVQPICSGGTAVFNGTSSVTNANFTWAVAGALPAGVSGTTSGTVTAPNTAISLSFTNTGSTQQTISVNVTPVNPSQNPCAGAPVVIKVQVNPIPVAPSIADSIKACQGSPATALTATAATGNHLLWYDANLQVLAAAPTPNTATPAQFIYFVSQANGFNCESPKKKVVVVINATPAISFVGYKDPTDCGVPSGSITIAVTDLSGTIALANTALDIYYNKDYSTTLSGPFSNTTDATGQLTLPLAAGTYANIRVAAKGCASNTIAGPYSLKDPTPPGKPTAGFNSGLCSNDSLRLTALSVPGVLGNGSPNGTVPVTYVWAGPAFGNGNYITSASTITIAPPLEQKAGFYVVYAKQGNCRSVETSFTVTVKQAPATPSVITRSPLCVGDVLNLQASSSIPGNNPLLDYTWTGPGLSAPAHTQNIRIPNVKVTDGGLYSITVVAAANGCSAKTDTFIGIGNYPEVDLGPSPLNLPIDTQFTLRPVVKNAGIGFVLPMQSYTWTPASDIMCYGAGCDSAVYTVKGNTCLLLKATNIYGCSDTASVCITSFCKTANLTMPNAFTPNGDNQNEFFTVKGTGIIHIRSFRVFNRVGQMVFERKDFPCNNAAYGWNGTVGGNKAATGTYVYVVEADCEKGGTIVKKGFVILLTR